MVGSSPNYYWYAGTTRLAGLTGSGNFFIYPTTPSSSPTTGALIVGGGVGVGGNLNVGGGISLGVSTKTSSGNLNANDAIIFANATNGALTLILLSAVTYPGKIYRIKKIDSSLNAVTIAAISSQTIDGSATTNLNMQYSSVTLVSDGANWFKF